MNPTHIHAPTDAAEISGQWLSAFAHRLAVDDFAGLSGLFAEDGHWKDLLGLTWEHRTFSGRGPIVDALSRVAVAIAPRNIRPSTDHSAPLARRRSGKQVVEAYFDFDTNAGRCTAFVRLRVTGEEVVAWILLTTLQGLHGFEERTGSNRALIGKPSDGSGRTWKEMRIDRQAFGDREPEVIVIGAGHAGLTAAARLTQLGVDTLVIEKKPRVGDNWRDRYSSLTLHNDITANHLPYMPFPKTWPMWLSKDQLGQWLEFYAQSMELNIWPSTEMCGATYDAAAKRWTVDLRREDGMIVQKTCRHMVVATGVSGSVPNWVELPGAAAFGGNVLHSSDFRDSSIHAGKNVIVVGTGSSGHDIANELIDNGAKSVSMLQRGPTCVISRDPGAIMIYAIYRGDEPTEDVDLVAAAIPYPLLHESYKFITAKAAELDKELLDQLNARGMKTFFGDDETGFQMMYMRGQGGYYIDVGCSELIANGTIGIIQFDESDQLIADGLKMKDGSVIPCDIVVLSTGFKNMQENIRIMFGDAVAEKVGKVWGFDEDYQMRAMWRRTGQEGLWITGGSLLDSRIFSRFMTLEIKADLEGLLPNRDALPLRPRGV